MKYLRTDIYDMNEYGNIINSSEITENWDEDYEAAIDYLVRRGADETQLRKYGVSGDGKQSFSVCVWENEDCDNGCPEWLDNASEAHFSEHFSEVRNNG